MLYLVFQTVYPQNIGENAWTEPPAHVLGVAAELVGGLTCEREVLEDVDAFTINA
jgi:hypothetical protein